MTTIENLIFQKEKVEAFARARGVPCEVRLFSGDTKEQLLQLFRYLSKAVGLPGKYGTLIPEEINQLDFARALGRDLRSVNRVMAELKKRGVFVKKEKRFHFGL